ncbi:hypothetical protein EFM54_11920 [Lentilactobacillus buchneri]|uniref:hypothetical protein n=1 Tax=Lentilactobacillus buchneri TaxID=1581 RepID=UPI0021A7FBC2|nr:hypothetical protein [Lentilactobacillus buchneri]MCT2899670.1 hypothetical protein [Lentilactobacillus buchneri]
MKLLKTKINRYYKRLEQHRMIHHAFFIRLLEAIRDCEDAYGSVMDAPNDSKEMWMIRRCVNSEPVVEFKELTFPEMSTSKVYRVCKDVGRLVEMGFTTREISHILEVQLKCVRTTINRYRDTRYSSQRKDKTNEN